MTAPAQRKASITPSPNRPLTKLLRLRSATDFERVRRDGRSHAHPLAVLIACRRPAEAESAGELLPPVSRLGVMAGRRVGTAVQRNRAKRLLREAVRARSAAIADGWDIVLVARQALAAARLAEAQAAVDQLLQRARLLRPG